MSSTCNVLCVMHINIDNNGCPHVLSVCCVFFNLTSFGVNIILASSSCYLAVLTVTVVMAFPAVL
jgi:hypothetical protein